MPKPFNLERALAGDKIVTRDGTLVNEIYHFKTSIAENPIRTAIEGSIHHHRLDGRCDAHSEFCYDLFMADEEKEMCVVCDKQEIKSDNFDLCDECGSIRDRLIILKLAKRIKALEEKLK